MSTPMLAKVLRKGAAAFLAVANWEATLSKAVAAELTAAATLIDPEFVRHLSGVRQGATLCGNDPFITSDPVQFERNPCPECLAKIAEQKAAGR